MLIPQELQLSPLLAVGHGLINRAVQAHIQGVTLQHLRSVPKMDNAELRLFML